MIWSSVALHGSFQKRNNEVTSVQCTTLAIMKCSSQSPNQRRAELSSIHPPAFKVMCWTVTGQRVQTCWTAFWGSWFGLEKKRWPSLEISRRCTTQWRSAFSISTLIDSCGGVWTRTVSQIRTSWRPSHLVTGLPGRSPQQHFERLLKWDEKSTQTPPRWFWRTHTWTTCWTVWAAVRKEAGSSTTSKSCWRRGISISRVGSYPVEGSRVERACRIKQDPAHPWYGRVKRACRVKQARTTSESSEWTGIQWKTSSGSRWSWISHQGRGKWEPDPTWISLRSQPVFQSRWLSAWYSPKSMASTIRWGSPVPSQSKQRSWRGSCGQESRGSVGTTRSLIS